MTASPPQLVDDLFSVHLKYSNALVETASLAYLVRSLISTAICAYAHCRCIQLPNSRTSFITSCFGDLILWYCHVGTSFLFQTVAGGFIQIAPTDIAQPFTVLLTKNLCREHEQQICYCCLIQINAVIFSHKVRIIRTVVAV